MGHHNTVLIIFLKIELTFCTVWEVSSLLQVLSRAKFYHFVSVYVYMPYWIVFNVYVCNVCMCDWMWACTYVCGLESILLIQSLSLNPEIIGWLNLLVKRFGRLCISFIRFADVWWLLLFFMSTRDMNSGLFACV